MTSHTRRTWLALAAASSLGAPLPAFAQDAAAQAAEHMQSMMAVPPGAPKVAMLIYPDMVALDLVGPLTVFRLMRWDVQLVWKTAQPVSTDIAVPLAPTLTFATCPKDLDILFVPGGIMGTIALMNDPEVLAFLADRGARAKWVTSVCTGSLVLAAAGLLKGYDATSHWSVVDLLPLMGARHADERVVIDRNRMTGGGITAGIDFGLTLASRVVDEASAKRVELIMEYAPAPPFHTGTPAQAGADLVASLGPAKAWMDDQALRAAQAAGKRLGL